MDVIVKGGLDAVEVRIDVKNPLLSNGKELSELLCDRKWPGEVQMWVEVRGSRGDKNVYHYTNFVGGTYRDSNHLALFFKYN